uniref:Ciliary BBSome complex subunit 2 N-terminal domain-containing protein n=1 Tax=Arion vulgaris TaxID=1028688 RepID=A0A0B7AYL6_9EUPU
MTQGRFIPSNKLNLPPGNSSASESEQVALGANNGAVYILHNFNVTLDEYVNANCSITNMCTVPQPDSSTDLLLCAGHFSALHLYKDGQILMEYPTSDWVTSIAKADIDDDGALEIVIGCKDNTVVALKM